MRKFFSAVALATFALAAAGCGGGGDSKFTDDGGSGGGPGVGGAASMGHPAGTTFNAGSMGISSATLAAGGATSLQVAIQKADGTLYTDSVSVTFNSSCAAQGRATIQSPVITTSGIASTTYAAQGCSGDDVITATATISGKQLTSTGTVKVASAAIGSIEFVSATPTNVGLQGTGGAGRQETSTVVFRVVDSSGGARADADVTFSLDSTVGGISLTPTSARSDANGRVQTIVNAGTVATTATVTARIASPAISTQSSQLTITTGIPDADSFSVAVACHNVEAWEYEGVVVPVTARLSDRFNNPPPDGTAVTFRAEGGSIVGQCPGGTVATAKEGGVCGTNWRSSAPRPADGRVTILATTTGEESFTDVSTDGLFTSLDGFRLVDEPGKLAQDLGEPYLDENENGQYDVNEPFFDFFNQGGDAGVRNGPDGKFNGLLCQDAARCDPAKKSAGIGASNVIIMSGSAPDAVEASLLADSSHTPIATIDVPSSTATTVSFFVHDQNGNPMPSGTTVSGAATGGRTVPAPTSSIVPCTDIGAYRRKEGTTVFTFTIVAGATVTPGGKFTLQVSTPGPGNGPAGTITNIAFPFN
ncbi:MAG: hypothetical protein ABI885_05385 [Gammaproteobacteria bacterium]